MKLLYPLLFALVFSLILAGCSGQPDYLQASSLPPIEVPEGSNKERLGQLYPVPESSTVAPDEFKVPFPPTVSVQDDANIASLQTMANQSWVLNAKDPAATWSQLLTFFQQRQIPVIRQDLSTATLTSDWFDEAVQPGFTVRYRLRLERGMQFNTTEIYVSNQLIPKSQLPSNPSSWSDSLQDTAHGNWLVNQLLGVLNNPQGSVGDSYLAATIELPEKVRLSAFEGEPVLSGSAPVQRLNRAFSKGLDENGLITYAANDDFSIFHFNQYKVKEKKSRWYNPFSWGGNKKPEPTSRYSLEEILANLPDEPQVNALFPETASRQSASKLSGVKGYLLIQQQVNDETLIYVRDGYGRRLTVGESRELLDIIRLRLI